MDLEPRREVWRNADNVSVLALQGGAGDNNAIMAEGELLQGLFAKASEPVPSVGVCEGDAVAHLVDVLWRVKLFGSSISKTLFCFNTTKEKKQTHLVSFQIGHVEGFSNVHGNSTFTAACRTSDEPYVVVSRMGDRGVRCGERAVHRDVGWLRGSE